MTAPWLSLAVAGFAAAVAPAAWGAAFISNGSGAWLGQPLDFSVVVRLEAGETLDPGCVAAEVQLGDRLLPSGAVRTVVDSVGAGLERIRVRTTTSIDEPALEVQVSAGCTLQLSRRFVVLVDPPPGLAMAVVAAGLPLVGGADPATPAGSATSPSVPMSLPAVASPAFSRSSIAAAANGAAIGAVSDRPLADTRDSRRALRAARLQRSADAAAARPRASVARAPRPAPLLVATAATTAITAAAAPRLQLEPAEPPSSPAPTPSVSIDQALAAVAEASRSVQASASAASAAERQVAELQRTVDGLRREAQAQRQLVLQMQNRLRADESGGRWTPWLLSGVVLLAALAGGLAWRMSSQQRRRAAAWPITPPAAAAVAGVAAAATSIGPAAAVDAGPLPNRLVTAPVPFVTSQMPAQALGTARQRPAPAWPPPSAAGPDTVATAVDAQHRFSPEHPQRQGPMVLGTSAPSAPSASSATSVASVPSAAADPRESAVVDTITERTEVLPPRGLNGDPAARDVTIEELIDLEQQAEFFVVLGQDEAAVELLVQHLRDTGGGSPLPYLKLLEIHHRRGERVEYERMRARFNHRFNAYAPDWDDDLQGGRTLESYGGVVPRLQQVWGRPLDAMAELEALLFRKSRGQLFDLPAYREVLFLYSLARDLLDRETVDPGHVDLLLPLSDGTEFSSTAPAPYLGLERDRERHRGAEALEGGQRMRTPVGFDDRPTAPIDLDLSTDSEPPSSIFDALEESPQHSSRR